MNIIKSNHRKGYTMKKKNIFLLTSIAAAGVYSVATGKGIFNKPRFKEQHEVISRYVDSHYPGATYAPISATANGYMTVIRRIGKSNIMLYAHKSADGVYDFTESEIS